MSLAPVRFERADTVRIDVLPPLAVYAHIPWCVRKCPYCDFNSHERKGELPEAQYVELLLADLDALLPSVWGRRATSVFIGGGTPSLFAPDAIAALVSGLRARLPLAADAEITLEANPGTAEASRFRGFREAGVNRLSLGVQSFNDTALQALGRIHDADEARRAVDMALTAFDNVNIDLMYGLPGQTLDAARADIEEAARKGSAHVSAYQLGIEPNTVFHRKPPQLPAHDVTADMQRMVEDVLAQAQFEHYETSAFARPGRRSRHNLNYWEFGDYLGLGAGAHGKISFPDRITRHERAKQPREHAAAAGRVEARVVAAGELPFEFMLNALRLIEGVPPSLYPSRTGLPLSSIEQPLRNAVAKGLIARDAQRIAPTELGRRFLNDALELFLHG